MLTVVLMRYTSSSRDPDLPKRAPSKFRKKNWNISSKNKWIVITTIAYATSNVKFLASLSDWQVLIVADTKTPENWARSNCIFLGLEQQGKLGYKIVNKIPINRYARKAIGYLFAIQNGAKFIYDTDDDNRPRGADLNFNFRKTSKGFLFYMGETSSYNVFNPYGHFGRPDMWPRGYPLRHVATQNKIDNYQLCTSVKTPTIQQGLVDRDSDVDAIYRLTHVTDPELGLVEFFDRRMGPVALGEGVYAPFNTQNTLFHSEAFWALLIPTTVTFRVSYIWRSYIAQCLMHTVGQNVAFFAPTAIQHRNPQKYLDDFWDETDLYLRAERFIDFLTAWNCSAARINLPRCMLDLYSALVQGGFLGIDDLELAKFWIEDLESFGYDFPKITAEKSKISNCRPAYVKSTPASNLHNDVMELYHWCKHGFDKSATCCWSSDCKAPLDRMNSAVFNFLTTVDHSKPVWPQWQNVALVITLNYPFNSVIGLLQRIYENIFPFVIFCSSFESGLDAANYSNPHLPSLRQFSFIHVTKNEILRGIFAYFCTIKALELQLNVDGYLILADDAIFNLWLEQDLSKFRLMGMFRQKRGKPKPPTVGSADRADGLKNIGTMLKSLKDGRASMVFEQFLNYFPPNSTHEWIERVLLDAGWACSDAYYLPGNQLTKFYDLASLFYDFRVHLELAIPKIALALSWTEYFWSEKFDLRGIYIEAGPERKRWMKWYDRRNISFLHPVKPSALGQLENLACYCDVYLRSLMNFIF